MSEALGARFLYAVSQEESIGHAIALNHIVARIQGDDDPDVIV